jgi:hypothetical protein
MYMFVSVYVDVRVCKMCICAYVCMSVCIFMVFYECMYVCVCAHIRMVSVCLHV